MVDEETITTFAHDISDLVEQHMDRMSRGEEPFALETDLRRTLGSLLDAEIRGEGQWRWTGR